MTIQQLVSQGIRKATQANWPPTEWIELPSPDPSGITRETIRFVDNGKGCYFWFGDFPGDDYIEYHEPIEEEDFQLQELGSKPEISFEDAKRYVLKFGPASYRLKTLDEVARTNGGLRYLDWLLGRTGIHASGSTKEYLQVYLSNDGIKRDLESLI